MKLYLYFAIIILALNSAFCISQSAEFFVKKPYAKFNRIKEGEILTHYFVFKNTGKTPLIIEDYGVSCFCTSLEFPKYPIQPGKTDSIKLNFNSKGKTGNQNREIVVYSNSKRKETFLSFKVFVGN